MSVKKRILITGGGSGGHVSPAVAVIDQLNQLPGVDLLYIGGVPVSQSISGAPSIEQRMLADKNVKKLFIRGGKLQRKFHWSTVKLFFGVFGGLIDSWREVRRFRPDVIFSTGGYVSVPVCLVGWLLKVPIYIHEQTAGVGLANRTVGKLATKIFISFEQSRNYFNEKKTMLTGNIVRPSIFEINEKSPVAKEIAKMLTIDKPIVFIAGGGQGSHFINLLVRQMLLYALMDFQIILQTGDNDKYKDFDVLWRDKLKLPTKLRDSFLPMKFIKQDEIGYVFKNCDIYVGRAGANFVYEMGLYRKPSLLIPIPWVTNNEQEKNAQVLVDCGLGRILPQGEMTAERLHQEIKRFATDLRAGKVVADEEALVRSFRTDALDVIVKELLY